MVDGVNNRGSADRTRINVGQAHERAYWSKALHVTRRAASQIFAGTSPDGDA